MKNLRHHYGLRKDPFPQNIPVKDLYQLPSLSPLKQRVFFAIEQKAISVITGDVGSGKSTSIRYVASQWHPSEYHQIPIVGGEFSLIELYRKILITFGIQFHSYQISFMIQKIREQILEVAASSLSDFTPF